MEDAGRSTGLGGKGRARSLGNPGIGGEPGGDVLGRLCREERWKMWGGGERVYIEFGREQNPGEK